MVGQRGLSLFAPVSTRISLPLRGSSRCLFASLLLTCTSPSPRAIFALPVILPSVFRSPSPYNSLLHPPAMFRQSSGLLRGRVASLPRLPPRLGRCLYSTNAPGTIETKQGQIHTVIGAGVIPSHHHNGTQLTCHPSRRRQVQSRPSPSYPECP